MSEDQPSGLLKGAKNLELNGELEKAELLYEKIIKMDPLDEQSYNRLLIILRKQKKYIKELSVINKGIKSFKDFYDRDSKKNVNKKIIEISKALLKSTGLADKKGLPLYEVEPIGRWTRRKLIVEKKLNS